MNVIAWLFGFGGKRAFVTAFDKVRSMPVYESQDGAYVEFGDGSIVMLRPGGICIGCEHVTGWRPQSGWTPEELQAMRHA